MSEGSFEAKNYMYRKNKDGIIVGVVVHPNDADPAFAALPIGARLMIAWAQIGDDEKRIENDEKNTVDDDKPVAPTPMMVEAAKLHEKMRRPFSSLSLVQQCAMRCEDSAFREFMVDRTGILDEDVPAHVRGYCGVMSRAELATSRRAADKWLELERQYQNWLTDQKYAEARR